MLKHKKILLTLPILSFFMLFSCKKVNEPYEVYKQQEDEPTHLVVTSTLPETIKSGEKLDIDCIKVTYNEHQLTWLGEKNKDFKQPDKFFLLTNPSYPTNSIVVNLEVTTNVERNDLNFCVGYFNEAEQKVYVSRTLKIAVTNDSAIKPWVWYTVTAVVVFGVVGMVMYTRYRKRKQDENISK